MTKLGSVNHINGAPVKAEKPSAISTFFNKFRAGERAHNVRAFLGTINERFVKEGYGIVAEPYVLEKGETIFNRGLTGARSNFFVFVKDEGSKAYVHFTNPSTNVNKKLKMSKEELVVSIMYEGVEDPKTAAEKVVSKALETAKQKNENVYFMHPHFHLESVGGEKAWDDGVTPDRSTYRKEMEYNYDISVKSGHNWIGLNRFRFMKNTLENVGIVAVPGFELSVPFDLSKDKDNSGKLGIVNGAHFVVMCADEKTALEIREEFLRKKLDTPGRGVPGSGPPVEAEDAFAFLRSYRERNELAIFAAHPALVLVGAGLYSQVALGNLPYSREFAQSKVHTTYTMLDILAKEVDGVERFNGAETPKGVFKFPPELTWLAEILAGKQEKLGLSRNLVTNVMNETLGREFHGQRRPSIFGHDDHHQHMVRYTNSDLTSLGRGYTVLKVYKGTFEHFEKLGRKPNASEIVEIARKNGIGFVDEQGKKRFRGAEIEGVAFAKWTKEGYEVPEAMGPTWKGKIKNWVLEGKFFTSVAWKWIKREKDERELIKKGVRGGVIHG
ncbi:MAG: hypothetical protein ABIH99_01445 [Candidatus Micrarchaeota archaeon]